MTDYFFEGYRMVDYYDDYLGGHTNDFDFWVEALEGYNDILEIACGTGRITLILLDNGKQVTAMDYSQEMLNILKEKTDNLFYKPTIINGDMRNYDLNKCFDAVIITANSVNHLEKNADLAKTLECAAKHLKKDGILIFDALNPELNHLLRDKDHFYDHDQFFAKKSGEKVTICENSFYDKATQISSVDYYYKTESGKETVLNIKNRFYFPQELDYIVESSSFKKYHKYGAYDFTPFTSDSKEQIYILEK